MSAADEGEWSALPPPPSYFNPRERAINIHLKGGWVHSRASTNIGKDRSLLPLPEIDLCLLGHPACSPVTILAELPASDELLLKIKRR